MQLTINTTCEQKPPPQTQYTDILSTVHFTTAHFIASCCMPSLFLYALGTMYLVLHVLWRHLDGSLSSLHLLQVREELILHSTLPHLLDHTP